MNKSATIRFVGAASELITTSADSNENIIIFKFAVSPSIKDTIESLGPPHTEIIAIIANQHSVGFDYLLVDGDDVVVYSFDTNPALEYTDLIPNRPPGKPKFILDVHLGGLARYLRLAGFDTHYSNVDIGDSTIAAIAQNENRILLTRDVGLLKRTIVQYGYWLRNTQPQKQFTELVKRYRLVDYVELFSRCTVCNGLIESVDKPLIRDKLPIRVRERFEEFWRCRQCLQVYWKGSHYDAIKKLIDELIHYTRSEQTNSSIGSDKIKV